jgi:hypothetical protein
MFVPFTQCPETQLAPAYLLGNLSEPAMIQYENHYFVCRQCKSLLEAYDALLNHVMRLAPHAAIIEAAYGVH